MKHKFRPVKLVRFWRRVISEIWLKLKSRPVKLVRFWRGVISEIWLLLKPRRVKLVRFWRGVISEIWLSIKPRLVKLVRFWRGVISEIWLSLKYRPVKLVRFWRGVISEIWLPYNRMSVTLLAYSKPVMLEIPFSLMSNLLRLNISFLVIFGTLIPSFSDTAVWSFLSGIQVSIGSKLSLLLTSVALSDSASFIWPSSSSLLLSDISPPWVGPAPSIFSVCVWLLPCVVESWPIFSEASGESIETDLFESVVFWTCCGDVSCSCATAVNGANTVCDSNSVTTNADENFEDI